MKRRSRYAALRMCMLGSVAGGALHCQVAERVGGPIASDGPAHSQILHRRGSINTPELALLYDSPAFADAYQAAEAAYAIRTPEATRAAVWNTKKPQLWLSESEQQMLAFVNGARAFNDRLELASDLPEVRHDPVKLAQIAQLQDRLTANGYEALNQMVRALDVGTLFTSNRRGDLALLWKPWPAPADTRVLNYSRIETLLHFVNDLNYCFGESARLQIKFARTASFSSRPPMDEDDKPLDYAQAAFFWQWHNHATVDKAIATLQNNLSEARALAAEEGLLGKR